jgi:hypothetical protein
VEQDAARSLDDALAIVTSLRGREARERHRRLLAHAIDQAERALPAQRAPSILARAHAARAEDALHGAGQLSLSAQRAPTVDACDAGWRRVEMIVAVAEDAARAAERAGEDMIAVARAAAAARAARTMLDARNHAYTFHTDDGFSFGEGWYVAAAALLGGAAIQIEPGKEGTPQAERFLRDAGLAGRLAPFRSRPRANKQTTDIIARAFRADPNGAQEKLRAAFLGDAPISKAVRDFIDARLSTDRRTPSEASASGVSSRGCRGAEPPDGDRRKVLLWIRHGVHHPGRNTDCSELAELTRRVQRAGLLPILVGDAGEVPARAVDMLLFFRDPIFRGDDGANGRRAQLQFFEHLRQAHGVVGQIGVTTAGMDGPALIGTPTMYLTDSPNVRMRAWVGAVPGYREVVRESGYLERVDAALRQWNQAAPG